MGDNKDRCINCKHFHKLKHNFKIGEGFEYGYCCTVLLTFENENTKTEGFVLETEINGICEMYESDEVK